MVQDYSIRLSKRARYLRLTVSLAHGVTVVIPAHMSKRQVEQLVPDFIREKQSWIQSTMARLQVQQSNILTLENCQLPDTVYLKALDITFSIHYFPVSGQAVRVLQKQEKLLAVTGDLADRLSVFKALQQFFKSYARGPLKSWLDKTAEESGLSYNRLTVRAQKTRWGSCSSRRNINLNYRLLFLDEMLVDYILMHELVHTQYMNHSKDFWQALEDLMPDARARDKAVNKAGKQLPGWLLFH